MQQQTPLDDPDFRAYAWRQMLAQVGQHGTRVPQKDTIGREVKDRVSWAPKRAVYHPFNQYGISAGPRA